jgi:DNA-binding response OmpR family regulator
MYILPIINGPQLSRATQSGLEQRNLAVDCVQNAISLLAAAEMHRNACLLPDQELLEEGSLSILCKLRRLTFFEAILIITIRDHILDRVLHVGSGAEDAISKSIALAKLAIRIHSATRLANGLSRETNSCGNIKINVPACQVRQRGETFSLDNKIFSVFTPLLKQSGQTLFRPLLKEALYEWKEKIEINQIEVHVEHIRRKLSKRKRSKRIGYAMDDTVDQHLDGSFQ